MYLPERSGTSQKFCAPDQYGARNLSRSDVAILTTLQQYFFNFIQSSLVQQLSKTFSEIVMKNGTGARWKELDTGCPVEYNIQFSNQNNLTLGNVTAILGNSTFYCTNNFSSAFTVIMWATFNNITGENSEVVPLRTFTTTTTTTSSTPTTVNTTAEGNIHCENR